MYASMSIASFGPSTLDDAKREVKVYSKRYINDVSDIEGSHSVNRYEKWAPRDESSYGDVAVRARTIQRHVPTDPLYHDDIEKSRPNVYDHIRTTKRMVNPLNPEYSLPSFKPMEPVRTEMRRDELSIDDIDGCRSKPMYKPYTRDILAVRDIEGTQPDWKSKGMRARLENEYKNTNAELDKQLLKRDRIIDKSNRQNDSLDPVYHVFGDTIADDKVFSKPRKPKSLIPDNHQLQTHDIPGASTAWREQELAKIKEIRNVCNTLDIEGAQHGTIKPGITTLRETHPLDPVYQSLDGGGDVLLPVVTPLVPISLVKTATLRTGSHGSSSKDTKGVSQVPSSPLMTKQPSTSRITPLDTQSQSTISFASKFSDTSGGSYPMSPGGSLSLGQTVPQSPLLSSSSYGSLGSVGRSNLSRSGSRSFSPLVNKSVGFGQSASASPLIGSPSGTARGSARGPSMAERRAEQERQMEISAVRDL